MLKFKKKTTSPRDIVQNKLENGHKILPFPQVVGQLLAALKDPNANSATFAKIIESDAALTIRLLRMANSPVYGNSDVIKSVGRATTILGNGPLKNIALTFAASTVFSGGGSSKETRESLWHHSLGCATTARQLAKATTGIDHNDAFLAGIFHDVGKLFFYDAIPDSYTELDGENSGESLVEKEKELYGVSHEEVGLKLVTAWQMPEALMVAVGYHHQPTEAIAHVDLATLVGIADGLANFAGIGTTPNPSVDVYGEAAELLGLDEDAVNEVAQEALDMFEETKQACSV